MIDACVGVICGHCVTALGWSILGQDFGNGEPAHHGPAVLCAVSYKLLLGSIESCLSLAAMELWQMSLLAGLVRGGGVLPCQSVS